MRKDIKEQILIPYFDHDKSISKTIKNSSSRRKMSPLQFAIRKIKNIFLYRLAYHCPLNGWRIRFHKWRGVNIGKNVYIGQHCSLDNAYPEYLYIGNNVSLAGGITMLAHSNPFNHFINVVESRVAPIIIEDGAWIGVGAIILLGVTVGENSIVSAGTVVDKNVNPKTIVRGNPMKTVVDISDRF